MFKKTRAKKQFIMSKATEIDVWIEFVVHPINILNDLKYENGLCLCFRDR